MTLVALLIGAILIVSALRNTYGSLFSALATDIPAFVVWAAAIVALGAIGFIPGLKTVSRGLLFLVIIVIIVKNYQAILGGFNSVSSPTAAQTAAESAASQQSTAASGASAASSSSNPATDGSTVPTAGNTSASTAPNVLTVTSNPANALQNFIGGVNDSSGFGGAMVGD